MAFGGPSLFGAQSNTNQPSGGLFGQQPQQQQQPQQASGTFFGQPVPQNTTATGGSMFGQPQQQNTAATGGGLFGQQQQQQPQQQTGATGGGLFGQQQQQPQLQTAATGGGLFGQQQQQNTAATGGGLFGQQPQQQQQNTPATGGGLFGQPQQPQQQTSTGGGMFGQPQQQQQPNAGSSLFGNSTNTNATGLQSQSSLYGGMTGNQGAGGLFGNRNPLQPQATQPAGAFGANLGRQSSQMQPQLGLSTNNQSNAAPAITKSTKFNDLPENLRNILESIETHIQGRVQIGKELHQRKLGEEPTKGQTSIRHMHKELIDIGATIRNDLHTTQDLKAKVEKAIEDTIVTTRIIDGFRFPQSGNTYLKDHADFPLEFFTRITDQMRERLQWYKSTIEQIERKLASSNSAAQTPQGIVATLQAQHATFLALANKTAALDGEVQNIKSLYTQLWRSRTGSVRDPFNDTAKATDKGDFGLSTLNVR